MARRMLWMLLLAARCLAGPAEDELAALSAKVPGCEPIALPTTGRLELRPEQSLTIDRLRNVDLDDDPPVLEPPDQPYPPNMTDDFLPGEAPYVAKGIRPFRFREFHCEFNYGGWHNWAMVDYAAAHGFDILSSYNQHHLLGSNLPAGTRRLMWGGYIDWRKWLPAHNLADGRYDLLADLDVTGLLVEAGTFKRDPAFDSLMIDMEHGRLAPDKLREQDWFPKDAPEAEQRALVQRYYEGYAKTYTAPIEAARQAGWHDISVYGWQPFGRTFWGLDKVALDPATDFDWNAFGKAIYGAVDILNPSVYCFYWSPANVAYTLANIDLNLALVGTMPQRKPMRPYYWTLLHGGGGGWRWWSGQPQPDEDVRAQIALCFFTGCDGFDTWNWSGTGNHHRPDIKADADLMVGTPFELAAETPQTNESTRLLRYDVVHVTAVADDGTVRFQRIDQADTRGNYGIGEGKPVYAMARDELAAHLRAPSEAVAATVEGLALVKPLEYLLRHGEPKIDVSAQEQFAGELPIVRRVKLGRVHVVATYDPQVIRGGEPRSIELADFDGHQGLTVVLPADAETRIFVLREP